MTTANSVYEAQKNYSGSAEEAKPEPKPYTAPASSSGYGYNSYNKWGGKLPEGTLVRFHADTSGVGVILEWDTKTKVYGVRWGADKVLCKGYRDDTLVALAADEAASIYVNHYGCETGELDGAEFFKAEVIDIEDEIKRLNARLEAAKSVKESYSREKKASKPEVASHAGGW